MDIIQTINKLWDERIHNKLDCDYLIIGGEYLEAFRLFLFKTYKLTLKGKDNKYVDNTIKK